MRTLLLADDSITVQRVIALTFAEEQFRVVAVSDGRQAIERMAAQKPDIVLAGTTLPQVDGYDLAKFVTSKAELKHVPVLLLSGAFETVDEARLASSGASGVIEKPVEPSVVISRVKELLGLKSTTPAPAAGRLITSAEPPKPEKAKLPTPPPQRALTSTRGTPSRWEQLRDQSGLEPDARPVENRDDYMDSLDAAFDSLDQQLAGRGPASHSRNPSPPLGHNPSPGDPRSPGRRPVAAEPAAGPPIFEVDDDWFSTESKARDDARAGRRETVDELSAPELQAPVPPAPSGQQVYEVDDEWFKEDDKAREARIAEQRQLAAEMGIHEVELPDVEPRPEPTAPVVDFDFDLGVDQLQLKAPPVAVTPEPPVVAIPRPSIAIVPPRPPAPEPPPPVAALPELPPAAAPRSPAPVPVPSPIAVRPVPVPAVPPPPPRLVQPPPPVVPPPPVEVPAPIAVAAPVPVQPTAPVSFAAPAAPAAPVAPVAPPAPPALEAPLALEAPSAPEASVPLDRPFATEPVARPLPELFDFAGIYSRRSVPAPAVVPPPVPAGVPTLAPIVPADFDAPPPPGGRDVADDFAALLAFERGENARPPMVEPIIHTVTPEITGEMLDQIATVVADRLAHSVRIEAVAPQITTEMLEQVAGIVSERVKDSVRLELGALKITDEMLDQTAATVAERLQSSLHIEPVAPQITGDMLDQIATLVGERLNAGPFGDRLRDAMTETVRETVRSAVSETSERLVRAEIDRIRSKDRT